MKRLKFFIGLFIACLLSFSSLSAKKLSEQSEVSLLTCSPGEEFYSLFGHSALRFYDPENKIDLVFNYGTFSFNTPNFYTKFARGKIKYQLAYQNYRDFLPGYIYEKRGITEQKLNLNLESKRRIFQAIIENYRPENRYYDYDFLFDNCSTRIRDIIEANVDGKIVYKKNKSDSKTFWNLLDYFIENSRWIYLGVHLVLGSSYDFEASPHEYLFLPDNVMYAFEDAIITNSGQNIPLVSNTKEILKPAFNCKMTTWYKRPGFIFSILALIIGVISIISLKKNRNYHIIDHLLFGTTGLLGWIIIFVWFFTDLQTRGATWNILWALPIHFPLTSIFLIKRSKSSYYYFFVLSIMLLIILASWSITPQSFPDSILPIVALLFIRSLFIVKKLKTQLINGHP